FMGVYKSSPPPQCPDVKKLGLLSLYSPVNAGQYLRIGPALFTVKDQSCCNCCFGRHSDKPPRSVTTNQSPGTVRAVLVTVMWPGSRYEVSERIKLGPLRYFALQVWV